MVVVMKESESVIAYDDENPLAYQRLGQAKVRDLAPRLLSNPHAGVLLQRQLAMGRYSDAEEALKISADRYRRIGEKIQAAESMGLQFLAALGQVQHFLATWLHNACRPSLTILSGAGS
eukprot:scaffold48_cov311-Pinguiococcus_pyrenoidosus.AAC.144